MIIDRKSEYHLKEVYLHGAEVRKIFCNYDKHIVKIPVQLHELNENVFASIVLYGVKHVDIDIFEPWGEGIYIQEVFIEDVKETQDEFSNAFKKEFEEKIQPVLTFGLRKYFELYPISINVASAKAKRFINYTDK